MPAPDPALLFPNAPLDSLSTTLAHLALRSGHALKFPRDVAPFAALLENTSAAVADLRSLIEPGESTYVVSVKRPPTIPGITISRPYPVRQFEWPSDAPLPPLAPAILIEPLTCAHAAEMVSLTDIAFHGFFRIRTCEMGPYFGIRSARGTGDNARGTGNNAGGPGNNAGRLVAMCGERLNIRLSPRQDFPAVEFPVVEFKEISGLCTHPDHRGRGYAAALLAHSLHRHRAAGHRSYLHVASDNAIAIALYKRLGFLPRGEFSLYGLRRSQ